MTQRSLDTAVSDALADAVTAPRYLVELQFDSGTLRLWNGLGMLSALGESWSGAGRLLAISDIKDTQNTVAAGIKLDLSLIPTAEAPDAPDAILNLALAENVQGRPATIYRALLDPETGALIGVFARFRGYMDTLDDAEIPDAVRLTLSCENRLVDLERVRRRTYTPEDQKARYAGDSFFDGVAALQNREIVLK